MLLTPVLLACLFVAPEPTDEKVHTVNQRAFRVPVLVDASRREEIRLLELHVSRDQGKTWAPCALIDPGRDSFLYTAPADGVYWFAVRLALKNDRYEPEDTASLTPALKVCVLEKVEKAPAVVQAAASEAHKMSAEELEEEVRQLRAELKRLKDRVSTLERLLKDRP
jgi:hypothetical protein